MSSARPALFACDLDRTLIYSDAARQLGADRVPTTCVEIYHDKPASFMTVAAADMLRALATRGVFVPVTTRTSEQYRRVRLPLPGPEPGSGAAPGPAFAITANGGVLLVDGRPDEVWARRVADLLAHSVPLDEIRAHLDAVCRPEFTDTLRSAESVFCYAVIQPARLPAGFVADVSGWAAERGWRTSLQGRKLYWVPQRLTKSAAVAEVAARTGAGLVLAAGDSLLDTDLLTAADFGIHPRHGELFERGWCAPHVSVTVASGIHAGEQILTWFATHTRPTAPTTTT